MNRRQALVCYILVVCSLVIVWAARAADKNSGDWTMRHSGEPGKVDFGLITYHDGTSHHESNWPVSAFQGLDLSKTGKQEVSFTISRDAGRFECKGYLEDGEGAGIFHFFPTAGYAQQMAALGFSGADGEKQFTMAVMDVTADFARQMKAENLRDLDTDKLIAFRIFNVNADFIEALRNEGLAANDSDKLVAFRIHGVSPEFIEKLHGLGYNHPDPDQLVAMRIHGVTPEYIANLRSRGMKDLSIDQLVSLRIHGID